jgi:hypothetical protein
MKKLSVLLVVALFVLAKIFTNSTGILGIVGVVAWGCFYLSALTLTGLGVRWVVRGRTSSRTG